MRQRYLIVKNKNGNYESFISTKWMTLEKQEDYEVITVCDDLNKDNIYYQQLKLYSNNHYGNKN